MQPHNIWQIMMNRKTLISICFVSILGMGCQGGGNPFHRSSRSAAPEPLPSAEPAAAAQAAPDNRTAMEAAIDTGAQSSSSQSAAGDMVLAPNAPDTYVVKRGDTLWGIAKIFLRDPWFWPEIWNVNPQIKNPHLIYPGDTLRLVYIDGRPRLQLESGRGARVSPRVRSEALEDAIQTIPYEIIASFMSKPTVLTAEQIKSAPYVLAALNHHVVMAEGNTIYARAMPAATQPGANYNVVRVGEALRDPDDHELLGYDGVYTGAGRVTRAGDPTTLLMTASNRETIAGDKLFPSNIDIPIDFIPSAPKVKIKGRIISVHDGLTMIGQYQVVVINRGARDGLAPGNVLAVYQAGERIADREQHSWMGGGGGVFSPHVTLPDERNGTFMVFKTFDRISYGLIMEAKDAIHVLDFIENP